MTNSRKRPSKADHRLACGAGSFDRAPLSFLDDEGVGNGLHARTAFADDWESNRDDGRTVSNLSEDIVMQLVRGLDGRRRTLVSFAADGADELTVGGGTEGRYVAYIAEAGRFTQAVTAHPPATPCTIVAGGQSGTYPPHVCLTLAEALAVSQAWAAEGRLADTVRWQPSSPRDAP